jgi:hypothetical protein
MAAVATTADEGVNRIVIKPIEFLEGNPSFRRAFSGSGYYQLPLGRSEVGPSPAVESGNASTKRDLAYDAQEKALPAIGLRRSLPCSRWQSSFDSTFRDERLVGWL